MKDGLDTELAAGFDFQLHRLKRNAYINMVSDFTTEGLC